MTVSGRLVDVPLDKQFKLRPHLINFGYQCQRMSKEIATATSHKPIDLWKSPDL